jgi:hypothetical protein
MSGLAGDRETNSSRSAGRREAELQRGSMGRQSCKRGGGRRRSFGAPANGALNHGEAASSGGAEVSSGERPCSSGGGRRSSELRLELKDDEVAERRRRGGGGRRPAKD